MTRKGWMAGGIEMGEARQGKKKRRKKGGKEGGLTTRRGVHTIQFQSDFKTV